MELQSALGRQKLINDYGVSAAGEVGRARRRSVPRPETRPRLYSRVAVLNMKGRLKVGAICFRVGELPSKAIPGAPWRFRSPASRENCAAVVAN